RCRPNDCSLKLGADEIQRLQRPVLRSDANVRASLDETFRQIVLERAQRYLAHGDENTKEHFSLLLTHSPYVRSKTPQLADYLDSYPGVDLPGGESFLYWSKETYAWKPMISVTHVTIVPGTGGKGMPEVLVVSRDVFSTRYTSGSLVLALLFHEPDSRGRYLVYVNRTWVDGIRWLWRPFVEYR